MSQEKIPEKNPEKESLRSKAKRLGNPKIVKAVKLIKNALIGQKP